MGLERVKEDVLGKAQAWRSELLKEAEVDAGKIRKNAEAEASDRKAQLEKVLKREETETVTRAIASAELEVQKKLLETKKALLEAVFSEVREKLLSLDDAERKKHVVMMLKKAGNELDVARVYCSERDRKAVSGVHVESGEMLGGMIAENADGSMRVDLRYEGMLEVLRERLAGEMAGMLFGKK